MALTLGKHPFLQVQRVMMLGLVWTGFFACALAASVYDVVEWLDMW